MAAHTRAHTPDADGKRVLNSIRRLVRSLRLFDRQAQAKHGLSAAQMFVLHELDAAEVLSLNELAERTATDQSSASVVVQRLVDAGLVTRAARKDDRRHVELRLTAKGRTISRRSPPPAQQKILDAIAAMPARQRKTFAAMLEAFVDSVGAPAKPGLMFEDMPSRKAASGGSRRRAGD
jgi:DNA-binding MarR family transcriptional regulator